MREHMFHQLFATVIAAIPGLFPYCKLPCLIASANRRIAITMWDILASRPYTPVRMGPVFGQIGPSSSPTPTAVASLQARVGEAEDVCAV
jgi:hypothetical protein